MQNIYLQHVHNNNYTFTAAPQGTYTYKLEVWGASGGGRINQNQGSHRGLGGYSTGTYSASASATLHVFVGGKGKKHNGTSGDINNIPEKTDPGSGGGGYNGGGNAYSGQGWDCYGGGGMTHISTTNNLATTTWSSTGTLIVAGGGGGSDNVYLENESVWADDDGSGGYGGGLVAERGHNGTSYSSLTAASQTAGYRQGVGENASKSDGERGGGGAGWWGGYASNGNNCGGGGGSGYIGGVTNGSTIAGNQSFPAPGGGNETGHAGNGFARITLTRL